MKILFVGLGRMGLPMARNLTKSPHKIYGFDLCPKNLKNATDTGIIPFSSNSSKEYDMYISMVPDAKCLLDFYNSDHGPLNPKNQNKIENKKKLLIDCSTIGPINAKKIYKTAKKEDLTFIDAPVSGGVMGAEKADLSFMVGSENPNDFNTVKSVLEYMGTNIFNCKKSGMGQTAKICNNLALAIQMRSISEAMSLGSNLGMDPKILKNILSKCTSNCWSLNLSHPMPGVVEGTPSSRGYENGFASHLIRKDLALAMECARESGSDVGFGELMWEQYGEICEDGKGEKDFGIVFEYLKNKK